MKYFITLLIALVLSIRCIYRKNQIPRYRVYWQSELTGYRGNGTQSMPYSEAIWICQCMNRKYRNELNHWVVEEV